MISNIAFTFFGVSIYWYGLVYFLGFLITYFSFINQKFTKLKKEELENIFLSLMIFSIIGGRFFHILFYDINYYLSNPIKIFYFWEGGMSIHGGILFGILSIYFMSKKYKFNFLKTTDFFVVFLSLFLSFGRIANHLNQEMPGIITNQKWGVVFSSIDNLKRVPISLIESLKNMFIFQILLYLSYFKKLKEGTLTVLFFVLYNGIRFFLEFFKDTQNTLWFFSTQQILCLFFFGISIFIYFSNSKE
jgi:phosphatidylglycerol---prolipoprotein diacylglyceryl transferase